VHVVFKADLFGDTVVAGRIIASPPFHDGQDRVDMPVNCLFPLCKHTLVNPAAYYQIRILPPYPHDIAARRDLARTHAIHPQLAVQGNNRLRIPVGVHMEIEVPGFVELALFDILN
jgi:hypothetical protein